MGNRLELQALLEALISSENVYFQPPEGFQMEYPCVRYMRNSAKTDFADDKPYNYKFEYLLTVIDSDPDSLILEKVATLPMCKFERHYVVDNLNHDVYSLYY